MTLGISFSVQFIKFIHFASMVLMWLFTLKNLEAKDMASIWFNVGITFISFFVYLWSEHRLFKEEMKYISKVTKNPANQIIYLTSIISISYIVLWILRPEMQLAGPTMLWLFIVLVSLFLACWLDFKLKLYLLPSKKGKK